MASEGKAALLQAINRLGSLSDILDDSIRPRQHPRQRPGLKARIDEEDEPLLPESDYEDDLLTYLKIVMMVFRDTKGETKSVILKQVHLRYNTPHHENSHVREVTVEDLRAVMATLNSSQNLLNKFGKTAIDEDCPTPEKPQSKRKSHVTSASSALESQDQTTSPPHSKQSLKRAFHKDTDLEAPGHQETTLFTHRHRHITKKTGFTDFYGDVPSSESDTESEGPITAWKDDQEDSTIEYRTKQGAYHKELRFRRLEKEHLVKVQGLIILYVTGQYVKATEFPSEEELWKKWQKTNHKDKEGMKAAKDSWTNHVQALDRAKSYLYLVRKERNVPIHAFVQQQFLQALHWKSLYADRSHLLKDQKYVTSLKKANVSRRLYEAEHRPSTEDLENIEEARVEEGFDIEDAEKHKDEDVEDAPLYFDCDDSDDDDYVPE